MLGGLSVLMAMLGLAELKAENLGEGVGLWETFSWPEGFFPTLLPPFPAVGNPEIKTHRTSGSETRISELWELVALEILEP